MRTQRIFSLCRSYSASTSSIKSKRNPPSNTQPFIRYQRVKSLLYERTIECERLKGEISEKNQEIGRLNQTINMIEKMSDRVQQELDAERFGTLMAQCVFLVMAGVIFYFAFKK